MNENRDGGLLDAPAVDGRSGDMCVTRRVGDTGGGPNPRRESSGRSDADRARRVLAGRSGVDGPAIDKDTGRRELGVDDERDVLVSAECRKGADSRWGAVDTGVRPLSGCPAELG